MKRKLPIRMSTLVFYLALTFFFLAVIIFIISTHSRVPEHHVTGTAAMNISVILDAGHGGMDGGAVSKNGTAEAPITLSISQKTQAVLGFVGVSSVLTRETDQSLGYDPSASLRDNKNMDLQKRLKIAEAYPNSVFISVHLNRFDQEKYYGAQTFYGVCNPQSKLLAEALQAKMIRVLDPENTRKAKRIPGTVYLMERVNNPAVTLECGFLSNPKEEALLKTDVYQVKIALAAMSGYLNYQRGS